MWTKMDIPKSKLILNLRVLIFSVSTLHHAFMFWFLLSIDFTKADDPRLWFYNYNKFNLITGWFNLILAFYYPLSCYCDWKALRNEDEQPHVQTMNKVRDFAYISILFPSVTFGDALFWRLWLYDRELLCPVTVDAVMPRWTQHSMHSYSLVTVLLELVLVPRYRPDDDRWHKRGTMAFISIYLFVVFVNYLYGIHVYTLIRILTNIQLAMASTWILIENALLYHAQWYLSDWIWAGKKNKVF